MQKILVALDFSDTSINLIKFSFAFNKHFFAQLHFIHVFQLPYVISPETEQMLIPYETLEKNYSDQLWSFIQEHKGDYHYDITIHVTGGGKEQEIKEYATLNNIDLLIIGNKERSRWGRWVSGSLTHQLLKDPPAHVLSIPSDYSFKHWEKIWVCTDLSMPMTDEQIQYIKFLADHLRSTVQFLHITDITEEPLDIDFESKAVISKSFQQMPMLVPVHKNIPETIEEVLRQHGGDALILFPHHHNWLDSFFLGHETTAISTEIDIPILSMKGMKR